MRSALPRLTVKHIAGIVAPTGVVMLTEDRALAERRFLGNPTPMTKDELVPLERTIRANLALGRAQDDRITAIATKTTRHGSPSRRTPASVLKK